MPNSGDCSSKDQGRPCPPCGGSEAGVVIDRYPQPRAAFPFCTKSADPGIGRAPIERPSSKLREDRADDTSATADVDERDESSAWKTVSPGSLDRWSDQTRWRSGMPAIVRPA